MTREEVLVRVSPEILDLLERGKPEPVVLLGIERREDGTYDMELRTSPDRLEIAVLRGRLHDARLREVGLHEALRRETAEVKRLQDARDAAAIGTAYYDLTGRSLDRPKLRAAIERVLNVVPSANTQEDT